VHAACYRKNDRWPGFGLPDCGVASPQKFELEKKLVSGKVRSGKGKKKVEKARRRAQREAAAAATADTTMCDAPKAIKGLGGAGRAQTQRAASAMETDA
jgi:hypothetical protein